MQDSGTRHQPERQPGKGRSQWPLSISCQPRRLQPYEYSGFPKPHMVSLPEFSYKALIMKMFFLLSLCLLHQSPIPQGGFQALPCFRASPHVHGVPLPSVLQATGDWWQNPLCALLPPNLCTCCSLWLQSSSLFSGKFIFQGPEEPSQTLLP